MNWWITPLLPLLLAYLYFCWQVYRALATHWNQEGENA